MTGIQVVNGQYVGPIPDTRYASGMLPSPVVGTHPLWFILPGQGSDAGRCTRYMHVARQTMSDILLVFVNPDEGGNPITVKCGIEYPSGTYYEAHFEGEDTTRSKVIAAGSFTRTQPLPITIPAGATFYTNTLVIPSASGVYPTSTQFGYIYNTVVETSGQLCVVGTTDYTTSANPGTGSGGSPANLNGYGPVAVCGTPSTPATRAHTVVAGIMGDSISIGVGDNGSPALGPNQPPGVANMEAGYLARALNAAGIPYLTTGLNGSVGCNVMGSTNAYNRMIKALQANASYVLWEWITNDLDNLALSTIQSATAGFPFYWQQMANRGCKVLAATCTPRTTSTDSWATVANQTALMPSSPATGNFGPETSQTVPLSGRQLYNGWLRDVAPMTIATLTPVAIGTSGSGIGRCATYGTNGALINTASGASGHPLLGTFDAGGVVESWNSANNTWVWTPGMVYTTDSLGVHPNVTGHIAMQAAVPTQIMV
jgi:hypothetical protein